MSFGSLKGMILKSVRRSDNDDEIYFESVNGEVYKLYHILIVKK